MFCLFLGRIPVITFVKRCQDIHSNPNPNVDNDNDDDHYNGHDILIARSGQPLVGPFMRYNESDEMLIDAIRTMMHHDNKEKNEKNGTESKVKSENEDEGESKKQSKEKEKQDCILNIIDARPSLNAYANMLRGKGTESLDRYPNCHRIFISIDNIHSVRNSFYKLLKGIKASYRSVNRELLEYWESQCHESGWSKHKRAILEGVAKIISLKNTCLVHCSDGWDRASQLTSLLEICLDPYYRTVAGLKCIIFKEWFSFGHLFRNRQSVNGPFDDGDDSEFSPIFPLFLDSLYALIRWFPDAFSYDQKLLLELWDESFIGEKVIWGNSELERNGNMVKKETLEWWKQRELQYSNKKIYNEGIIVPPLFLSTATNESIPCWIELFYKVL